MDNGTPRKVHGSVDGAMVYLQAIPMKEQPCSVCHGTNIDPAISDAIAAAYPDDLATGFEPGELRGHAEALLADGVAEAIIDDIPSGPVVEVHLKPGVMDPVAATVHGNLGTGCGGEGVAGQGRQQATHVARADL